MKKQGDRLYIYRGFLQRTLTLDIDNLGQFLKLLFHCNYKQFFYPHELKILTQILSLITLNLFQNKFQSLHEKKGVPIENS